MLQTATFTSAASLLRGDIIGNATCAEPAVKCAIGAARSSLSRLLHGRKCQSGIQTRQLRDVTLSQCCHDTINRCMLTLKLVPGCKVDSRTRILPIRLAGTLGLLSAESEKMHTFSKV